MSAVMNDLPEGLGYLMNRLSKYPLLTKAEELELGVIIQGNRPGRKAAIHKLMTANIRLVITIARAYLRSDLDYCDVVQEGMIGLYKAATKFDPKRGLRFTTLATWWIKQAIRRGINDIADLIRLPVHVHEDLRVIRKAIRQHLMKYNHEPTLQEISQVSKLPVAKIEKLLCLQPALLVLDQESGDSDHTLLQMMTYEDASGVEERVHYQVMQQNLDRFLKRLQPNEAEVLRWRYGLYGEPETLDQIAQRLGVSKETVRNRQNRAERRLRKMYEFQSLKVFLEEV